MIDQSPFRLRLILEIGRIDNSWGDRHLICACVTAEDHAEELSEV